MADYTININAKDNTRGALSKVDAGLDKARQKALSFKGALGAAGAALAAFGVGAKIKGTIDDFDALAKSARMAGSAASNEAFQGFQVLQTAMAEAGVDAGTFERAMLQTTSRLQKGVEGSKSFAGIVEKMGNTIVDSNGKLKDGATVMEEMVKALNNGTISSDEFAKVVGGRAGPVIAAQFASLNKGAGDLEKTLADVRENANIVPLDAAENAEVFNDTIGRLQMAFGKLMTEALTPLMPILTQLAQDLLANMPAIVDKVTAALETLKPVFGLIGTLLTDVVFPILSKVFEVLGFIAEAIQPLVDSAIPGLQAAFDGLVSIVESIVGFFQGVADSLQGIYDKAIQLKDGVAGTFDSMADGVKETTKEMTEGVKGFFSDMYEKVVGGSIVPDMVNGVIAEFLRQHNQVTQISGETTAQVTEDFENLGKSIEQDFVGTLESALSDGKLSLSDFEGFFSKTLTNILNDAMSGGQGLSSIFGSLFGGGGSGGGFVSSLVSVGSKLLGSIFGGGFADGGYLSAGKVGIVGESGPELISGPAQITPMDQAGGQTQVVFNINAIDTQTGTQFLLDNKKQIEGIISNAYTRRGRQGIY